MVKGPSEVNPIFTVSLNGVAIDHQEVREGSVACVQDFVRRPLFTQRNFLSETGISMLKTAVAAADAVQHSSELDPWGTIGVEIGPVIADLKSCREKVVSRRKVVKVTRERWFGAETVASSAVGEAAPRTTVSISNVVEVGDVQSVEKHNKLGLPCGSRSASSPAKSKKRRVPVSPVAAKKQFSVENPSASRPSFEAALEKCFEKSGAKSSGSDRRIAPVFQGGINNNLIVYLNRLLALESY